MSYTKTEWIDNVTIVDAAKLNKIEDQLETLDTQKVSRDGNKGLSSNDFTDAYKTKLDNLEDTISASMDDKVDKEDGKSLSSNDFTDALKSKVENIDTRLDTKVDKVNGKILTSNDFTDDYKSKVDSIANVTTDITTIQSTLDTKVDKDGNKVLSDNNFTNVLKQKVESIDTLNTTLDTKVDKVNGKTLTSNDFTDELKSKVEEIDGIQTKVDRLERASDVIEITAVDGNITLETNKIYRTNISSDTTFILPTIDDSTFSQILVQADVSDGVNIDFGTEYYFGSGYQGDAGKYNFIFEHNGSDWVYGALYTGGQ